MTYSIDDMRDAEWDYEFEPPEIDEDDAEEVAKWRAAIDRTIAERKAALDGRSKS